MGAQICVLNKIDLATVAGGPDRIEISAQISDGAYLLVYEIDAEGYVYITGRKKEIIV